jgi:type VI secretion system ImpC/EvpB family protein
MNLTATETTITGKQEKQLSELGFISLCECKYTRKAVFYSCQSIQIPKVYDRLAANVNSQLSIMLHYILCVSRFAHYIKVIGRDKMGSFKNAQECEAYLQQWLLNYVANIDDMSSVNKAKYPLREANVEVKEQLRNPGSYRCIIQLRPYYQPDKLESSLTLVTELPIRH